MPYGGSNVVRSKSTYFCKHSNSLFDKYLILKHFTFLTLFRTLTDTRTFLGVLMDVLDRGIGGGGWLVSEAFLGVGLNQMTLSHKGLKTPKKRVFRKL